MQLLFSLKNMEFLYEYDVREMLAFLNTCMDDIPEYISMLPDVFKLAWKIVMKYKLRLQATEMECMVS
jgi:hypothetical protein